MSQVRVNKMFSYSISLQWKLRVPQSVQCLTTDWTTVVSSSAEAEDFSSNLCVQITSEVHPASYPMATGGPFPSGKARQGRDADHSSHL
jgi:hypothetical protein